MQPPGGTLPSTLDQAPPRVAAERLTLRSGLSWLVLGVLVVVHTVWVLPVLPVHISPMFDPVRTMMVIAGMVMVAYGAGLLLGDLIGAGMVRLWRYGRARPPSRPNVDAR